MRSDILTELTNVTWVQSSKSGIVNRSSASSSVQTKIVTKSDIRSSPRDKTAWRAPLAYSASIDESTPWNVEVDLRDNYPVGGGFFEFVLHKVRGNTDLLEATNLFKTDPLTLPTATYPVSPLAGRAISSALSKLKDQQVQYSVLLMESGKTASMVAKNAKQIGAALRLIRKGNFVGAARELNITSSTFKRPWSKPKTQKQLSGRWLEAQYGWLPLMSDIYGMYEDVRKGFFREPRISVSSRASEEFPTHFYQRHRWLYTTGIVNTSFSTHLRLDYVLDVPLLQQAAQKGLTNPLEVAWELVPFSFVADWFIPVGDYLSALDSDIGLKFRGGTRSERMIQTLAAEMNTPRRVSDNVHSYSDSCTGRKTVVKKTVNRVVLSSSPMPKFYFKNPISAYHALNAIALIRQLTK